MEAGLGGGSRARRRRFGSAFLLQGSAQKRTSASFLDVNQRWITGMTLLGIVFHLITVAIDHFRELDGGCAWVSENAPLRFFDLV